LGSAPVLSNRSFSVTADVTIPETGASGMIFTQGGFTAGWGFYVSDQRLVGVHNFLGIDRYRIVSSEPLPKGKVVLQMEFAYDGGGPAKGGVIALTANGKKIGEGRVPRTVPGQYSAFEGQDIGMDTGSPIDDSYKPPFAFTGTIEKVTVDLR
jgi:hypothetical protein